MQPDFNTLEEATQELEVYNKLIGLKFHDIHNDSPVTLSGVKIHEYNWVDTNDNHRKGYDVRAFFEETTLYITSKELAYYCKI